MKALIHVQHLLGTGHTVRATAIGRALAARGVEVTLATGNRMPPTLDTTGLTVSPLPGARASDATFSTLLDESDSPIDDAWRERRARRTLELFLQTAPDIFLTETFPFGRKPFRFELLPILEKAKGDRARPLIASSIRDILVRKEDPLKERKMAELARRYYDLVLVHSDPTIVRLEASFPPAGEIADLIRYTGYVHTPKTRQPPGDEGIGEIIVSCGGGPVGVALLETSIKARPLTKNGGARIWRILVGHDHPQSTIDRLAAKAGSGIIVERARPDFPGLLARCALSVSQAGYNTVLDILSAGCRSVLIPFAEEGETEQLQRARALAEKGRAAVLTEDDLTAQALAGAIDGQLQATIARHDAAMDGAAESARILIEIAETRKAVP